LESPACLRSPSPRRTFWRYHAVPEREGAHLDEGRERLPVSEAQRCGIRVELHRRGRSEIEFERSCGAVRAVRRWDDPLWQARSFWEELAGRLFITVCKTWLIAVDALADTPKRPLDLRGNARLSSPPASRRSQASPIPRMALPKPATGISSPFPVDPIVTYRSV
jgi:hypothetical protein